MNLSWATQETCAAVNLVGSWSGETQYETNGFNYTPGAGTNRVALIVVAAESNSDPVANVNQVTLGGQTLTAIESADGVVVGSAGSEHNVLWFGYLNESGISSMSGNALSVTWDQAPNTPNGEIMVQAGTYQDVDQLSPVAVSASSTNTSASSIKAGSVTPGTGDGLVYVAVDGQPANHTAPGGYTEQLEQDGPANDFSCASVQRDVTTSSTENPNASWSVTSRLAIISAVLTEYVTIDLANGLVAFWKLNEGSGTNATDSSTNTNDGTLTNNPAWTDGVHGGAVDFDGVDDYIDAGSNASIDDVFSGAGSFTAWIYITGWGENGWGRIVDKASTTTAADGWNLQMNGTKAQLLFATGFSSSRGEWTTPKNSLNFNTWYHVAVVYDGSSTANDPLIYINGVSQDLTEARTPSGTHNTDAAVNLRLGNYAGGATRTFDGTLDDIRIYNRILSTAEIARMANGSGLVGHWKLDDGSGTTAIDSAGFNDGTLTNGPTWTTGRLCGALSLDGSNDYVELVDSSALVSGDASFSVSSWFQTTTLYDSAPNPLFLGSRIVTIYQSNAGSQSTKAAIGLYGDNTDTVMFMYANSAISGIIKTNTSFNDGNWHHLAGTYDAGTNVATLYYDGAAVASADAGTIVSAGTEPTRIGTGTVTNLGIFNGLVDDVRVFSRTLAPWEIQNLAATYQVIDLGSFSGEPSLGLCLNNSEQVGGYDEAAASGSSTAWFQQYCNFSAIAKLSGGTVNEALGINDAGTVVGWSDITGGVRKAFSWTSGGGSIDLGLVAGRSDSEAAGVNSSNEVVGTGLDFTVPPTNHIAFLYLPVAKYGLSTGMNSLGTLGGVQSVALDINDSGEVVGGAMVASATMKPFIWLPSAAYGLGPGMNSLGTLGGESNLGIHRAQAINATGEVVGRSYTAAGEGHAFHWQTGTMTDMGTLTGGTSSFAFDINDSGIAVGTANVTSGAFHAFVWDGTMTDLNDRIDSNSGWTLIRATGINNDREIVGWGTNAAGNVRAFMLVQTCGASTSTTGSLAASTLAQGAGVTDPKGEFEEVVLDTDGESLGEIAIFEAVPDATVKFQVTQPDDPETGGLGPAPGTLKGFAGGVALPRTLMVETSATPGDFIATVSVTFFEFELDDSAVDPEDVELHVLDTTLGPPPGAWVPAGQNIGESLPTGIVGDSGFEVHADATISFWAVRETTGVFAVGAAAARQDEEPAQPDEDQGPDDLPGPRVLPPVCGLGLFPLSLVGLTLLVAIRTRRYGVLR